MLRIEAQRASVALDTRDLEIQDMDMKQKALEIVSKISGMDVAKLEPKLDLVADLGIDSPKALQMLLDLEDGLGIEISDEDAEKLSTVEQAIGYIKGHKKD